MFTLLTKIFIKNYDDVKNPVVRQKYGELSGAYGIFLNVILFLIKFLAGLFSKSLAIIADAMNNLSDAGASVITVLGFKLSGKKPDRDHPFGHGRMEYITGLFVSFLILMMGVELFKSAVSSIVHPEPVSGSIFSIAILVISILIKAYMYFFNHNVAKKINSSSMEATAKDSLSDTISTLVVLISIVIYMFKKTSFPVDGIAGIFVAAFILKNGVESLLDTIHPLLGQPPEKEFVEKIEKMVMSHDVVEGVHDLIIHDYGPGRMMISLHAEVDGRKNIFDIHDDIDNIEVELSEKFNCTATIHMDPIEIGSKKIQTIKKQIVEIINDIDESLTIHDLRIVPGKTHTNVVFDLVKPHDCPIEDDVLSKKVSRIFHQKQPHYYCVIKVEPPFV